MTLKKITLSQMRPIVSEYHSKLINWQLIRKNNAIGRFCGPIAQTIDFELHRDGTYRPVSFIEALTSPNGDLGLHRYLNVKVRHVSLQAHPRMCDNVFKAMTKEFLPKIESPLNDVSSLDQYESNAVPKSIEAYSICTIHAYLGNEERALFWCNKFEELVNESGYWEDWDKERMSFLTKVRSWLTEGCAKQKLDAVISEEKAKRGFS